ncbi:MAG TPA: DsbA family oxidoreductase [Cyclobacteriaceae bacterium]|nr:DsbA family oxidoreductase [Cyclobacteriaceae bacterium]
MDKPNMQISIVSDVVCPWCYIGKRRLEKAIQALEHEFSFELQYQPFELNPDMPETGTNLKEYLSSKFGGANKYDEISRHVTKVAADEGLVFDFDKQQISPNTKKAHRIIWAAGQIDKQIPVVEAFFKAYFTDGIDLTHTDNLKNIALSAGLTKQEIENALQDDVSLQAVSRIQLHNRNMGINSVPFYIVNGKYAISGAQPTEVFISALKEIANTQSQK